jgi:transcriptional regulator with XRE-family HTH domain
MRRSTLRLVDIRDDIREFLTTRRARLTPDQVGLPDYGTRRVPGLRREEVAVLAGMSVPYYTRLERGDLSGASESVLHALAEAFVSTTRSAPTSSTSPAPPRRRCRVRHGAAAPSRAFARTCSGCWTR